MMIKRMLILFMLVLAGCVSNEQTAEQRSAAAKSKLHCTKEAPTGSIRRVSRCRTEAEIRAERQAAQEAMRNRTSASVTSIETQ